MTTVNEFAAVGNPSDGMLSMYCGSVKTAAGDVNQLWFFVNGRNRDGSAHLSKEQVENLRDLLDEWIKFHQH